MKKAQYARRWLSLLLALAMLLPGLGVLGGIEAGASLVKETSQNFSVIFSVPETIWLKPNGTNSMTQFERYSNVNADGTAELGTSATGKIYFSVTGATATGVNITVAGANATLSSTAGNANITAGYLPAGLANNTGTLITWTATFTVGGSVYSVSNYSYAYAPSFKAAGAAGKASEYHEGFIIFSTRYTFFHQAAMTITGVHSVSGGAYSPSTTLQTSLGNKAFSGNNQNVIDFLQSSGDENGEKGMNFTDGGAGGMWTSGIMNVNVTGGTGVVNVDTSRFHNLNQVPGLWFGWWITSNECKNADGNGTTNRNNPRIEVPTGTTAYNGFTNMNEGLKWSASPNLDVSGSGSSSLTAWGYTASGYDNSYYAGISATATVTANKIDKSGLRSAVHSATQYPIQKYSNNSAVQAALQAACVQLGNPANAAMNTADTLNTTVAANLTDTKKGPMIYFTAPEVIYLTPSTSTGNVSWQKFADNAVLEGASNDASPANAYTNYGTVQLCVPGATEVSIHCVSPNITVRLGYLRRWNVNTYQAYGDASTLTGTYGDYSSETINSFDGYYTYGRINGSASSSPNSSGLIVWRGTFMYEGVRYETYTYSYIYKPYNGIYGVAEHVQDDDGSVSDVETATYFMGVHSVDRETLNYLGNGGNGNNDLDNKRQIWDYDMPGKDTDGNGSANPDGRYFHTLAWSGAGQPGNNNWITDFLNRYSTETNDGKGSFAFLYWYSDGSGCDQSNEFSSPAGNLFVDVSRYSSVYQVPNFQWYTLMSSDDDSDNSWVWEFPGFYDPNYNNGAVWYDNANYHVRKGYTNDISAEFIAGPHLLGANTILQGYTAGAGDWKSTALPWNNLSARTRWDGTNKGTVQYREYNWSLTSNHGADQNWNSTGHLARVRGYVTTNLLCVDKSGLRAALSAAIKEGIQCNETTTAKWNTYKTRIEAVALALTQPDYSLTSAGATTLINNLTTAVNAIKGSTNGLTAKADHYSTTVDTDPFTAGNQAPATLLAETLKYSYSEKVVGAKEDIPGYVYKQHSSYTGEVKLWAGAVADYPNNLYIAEASRRITAASSGEYGWGDALQWLFYYDPIKYNLQYLPNGATGGMPSPLTVSNIVYDTYFQLAGNTPTRTNATFTGWLCSADGAVYQPGAKLWKLTTTAGETVKMTAQWDFKVTFIIPGTGWTGSKMYPDGTSVLVGGLPSGTPAVVGWYTDSDLTVVYDLATAVTAPVTIYGKLLNTGTPTVNLLAKNRWERNGTTSANEITTPLNTAGLSTPYGAWTAVRLPNMVLNRTKAPESMDIPTSVAAMNGTAGSWDATASKYGTSARYLADYFVYTNESAPAIVLQIEDLYPNGKKPIVTIEAFDGSTAGGNTAGASVGAVTVGGTLTVSAIYTEGSKKMTYAQLNPVFTGTNARGWAAYRITVRNFEGSYTADGNSLKANGLNHEAANAPTMDPKTGSETVLSFTVYVSYYQNPIKVTPGYTGEASALKGGDRNWSQYGLLSRHIGSNLSTSELNYFDCYYYQLAPGDEGLTVAQLRTKAKPTAQGGSGAGKNWPETKWQVGIRNNAKNSSAENGFVNKEAVFVHLSDRYGNTVQDELVQLNNFDDLEPTSVQNGNTVKVTERGGAGFLGAQLYQYDRYGGTGTLQKATPVAQDWNFTGNQITFTGVNVEDTFENRMALLITDRVGNEYVANLKGIKTAGGQTTGGGTATIVVQFEDVANSISFPQAELEAEGFRLTEPLMLPLAGIGDYSVEINGQAQGLFTPQSGILALTEPEYEGSMFRVKVLTLGAVDSLMVKSAVTGQAVTYKRSNAVNVTVGTGGAKIWTLEGNFPEGELLMAAKIGGDWGDTVTVIPVPALPNEGGEGQGIIEPSDEPTTVPGDPVENGDDPVDDPADDPATNPTDGETGGEDAPTPAPATKNFFQLLMEWLMSLFAIWNF